MKSTIHYILLACISLMIGNLNAQTSALSFTNPTVVGNKFRVSLHCSSVGGNYGMGNNNLRFNYSTSSLANPIIYYSIFTPPIFNATTTQGTVTSTGVTSINTAMKFPYVYNNNQVPITAAGSDLITMEWDIINSNLPAILTWRITGANPKTAIVDDDVQTVRAVTAFSDLTFNYLKPVIASQDVTLDCNTPSTVLTATNGGGSYLWSTGETTASITVSPTITTTYSVTATANLSTDEVIVYKPSCTTVSSRIYLPQINITTLLMTPYYNSLANFPLSDPYSTAPLNTKFVHVNSGPVATTTPTVLNVTGNDAIIDWVFLELRTGVSGSTTVAYTKSALLQADGDIVDMDGVSAPRFINAPIGDYYFTVRHRNHLGFRTANKITISSATAPLNLSNGSVAIYGNTSMTSLTANLNAMVGGDADADGSVDAFDTIVWEQQNGLFDDYALVSDYNLDGSADALDSIIWELNNGKFQELD